LSPPPSRGSHQIHAPRSYVVERGATEKKEICLCASTPVDSRMSLQEGEPVSGGDGRKRDEGTGKGALTLPTLRLGVGLPPTSSSSGASASLPPSTSSVRPSIRPSIRPFVCPRVYPSRCSRHRFLISSAFCSVNADLCEN